MGGYHADNPEFRRKAQKVFVDRATGDVVLRLHETDIVRVSPRGDVKLSTGGWATHKTLHSMNDALGLMDMWVESESSNPPRGDWIVYDSDNAHILYTNNKTNYTITIPAKTAEAKDRAKWLAEAYNVTYNPPILQQQPQAATRVTAAPRVVSVPSAPCSTSPQQPATTRIVAAAPLAGWPIGDSWASIARAGTSAAAAPPPPPGVPAHPIRLTGPGSALSARTTGLGQTARQAAPQQQPPPAAMGAWSNGPAELTAVAAYAATSPGGGGGLRALDLARSKLQAAAAAVPARPVEVQLQEHMKQLGIHEDELEDDTHLCVVCMENPRTMVLVPCGHMALCRRCCKTIIEDQGKECPMCCQPVEYSVEVEG